MKTTIKNLPPIDILINNAGIGSIGAAESFTSEQIMHVIQTNVMGVVNVTNAVLPSMRAQKSGIILTVSSLVGPLPDLNQRVYSGTKAMVEHYTALHLKLTSLIKIQLIFFSRNTSILIRPEEPLLALIQQARTPMKALSLIIVYLKLKPVEVQDLFKQLIFA
ncbi:SDR family NAD(P)-dependent oxidoreductase [Legionella sp. CNM-1927-20]|uniref:SDR family NAD(P)-dependent oxidoreductase n=1 Tax=Legionella sp. CNM-1927-20 TaxID=3422221 RepID=UPI00403AFB9A